MIVPNGSIESIKCSHCDYVYIDITIIGTMGIVGVLYKKMSEKILVDCPKCNKGKLKMRKEQMKRFNKNNKQ